MEIGAAFKPNESIPQLVRLAKLAEKSGFSSVGIFDDLLLHSRKRVEVYTTLTAIALNTKRVKIGPWCTNAYTRHPLTTAYTIATLDELSGKRAFLAIVGGGSHARRVAYGKPGFKQCEKAIGIFRKIFAGEQVEKRKWKYQLYKPMKHIPVYWGGENDISAKFGGRVSDGVIVGGPRGWVDEKELKISIKVIKTGAERSGRSLEEVPVILNTPVSISYDREAAVDNVMSYLRKMMEYIGRGADSAPPREGIAKITMAGTPEDCIRAIKTVEKLGIKKLMMVVTGNRKETLELFGERVLPEIS